MKTLLVHLTVMGLSLTAHAQPALTVYNQNFAVVRERLALDLKAGVNSVAYAGVTTQVEPDSVVLRDVAGKTSLRILEQSYRADTLSQGALLALHEGKTLIFLIRAEDAKEYRVQGKVIRSGYTPGAGNNPYGGPASAVETPIIEVGGELRFSLPGEPLFPALGDDAILKPTLTWQLSSDRAAKLDAELGYVTGGLSWQASYNLISPEKGDTLDIIGWVTIDNQSGKIFENAAIKLMAGDVNKVAPEGRADPIPAMALMDIRAKEAGVTEKAFDEFHLYSLPRPVTLRNRETKQVEFLRAMGVKAKTVYVYDGLASNNYRGWNQEMIRNNPDYGIASNKKVWVMREFENKAENGLGLPLPRGRTRFYRQDSADGRLEFTGENTIDHTPAGERVRIYTGDAFDLVGERKRADFTLSARQDQAEEGFEISLRNRKQEPVEVRVVEHLYRGVNWEILQKSDTFEKTEAQTIEFRVTLQPNEEKIVKYRVRYTWR